MPVRVNVSMPKDQLEWLKKLAKDEDRSVSEVLDRLVERYREARVCNGDNPSRKVVLLAEPMDGSPVRIPL